MKIFSEKKAEDYTWLKLADAYASFFISEILNEEDTEFKQIFYSLDKRNAMAMRDLTIDSAYALYDLSTKRTETVAEWIDKHDDCMEFAWKSVTCAVENYTDGIEPLDYWYYQNVVLGVEK